MKNEFLNNLDGFLVMLKYENPSLNHLKDFLEKDFLSWPRRFEAGKGIIDSFEKEMTPAHLLDERPLNTMAPSTREWFGEVEILNEFFERMGVFTRNLKIVTPEVEEKLLKIENKNK